MWPSTKSYQHIELSHIRSVKQPSCHKLLFHSGSGERWVALLLTLLSAAPSHQTSYRTYPTAAQFRDAIFEPDLASTFTNHPSLDPGLVMVSPARSRGFFFTAVPPPFFVVDSSATSAGKVPHLYLFLELLVRLRRQRNITILCV